MMFIVIFIATLLALATKYLGADVEVCTLAVAWAIFYQLQQQKDDKR